MLWINFLFRRKLIYMYSSNNRAKLFFDLNEAKEFASEIETIAQQVTITAGKSTNKYPILLRYPTSGDLDLFETIQKGPFYLIEKVNRYPDSRNAYHVRYTFHKPQGATTADMLQAQREIESYLNQKYHDLSPNTGVSRG